MLDRMDDETQGVRAMSIGAIVYFDLCLCATIFEECGEMVQRFVEKLDTILHPVIITRVCMSRTTLV